MCRTKINKHFEKCYAIFTGASKNRRYHLFQLADEDLEGFKAPCSGDIGWQWIPFPYSACNELKSLHGCHTGERKLMPWWLQCQQYCIMYIFIILWSVESRVLKKILSRWRIFGIRWRLDMSRAPYALVGGESERALSSLLVCRGSGKFWNSRWQMFEENEAFNWSQKCRFF